MLKLQITIFFLTLDFGHTTDGFPPMDAEGWVFIYSVAAFFVATIFWKPPQ